MSDTKNDTISLNLSQKDAREKCWNARDEYFACLDKEGNTDKDCKESFRPLRSPLTLFFSSGTVYLEKFESLCSPLWVRMILISIWVKAFAKFVSCDPYLNYTGETFHPETRKRFGAKTT
jgi:hypothetical protein